jgi:hypothetical protein
MWSLIEPFDDRRSFSTSFSELMVIPGERLSRFLAGYTATPTLDVQEPTMFDDPSAAAGVRNALHRPRLPQRLDVHRKTTGFRFGF